MESDPSVLPRRLSLWKHLVIRLMGHFHTLQVTIARSLASGCRLVLPSSTQQKCLHPVHSRKCSANKSGRYVHCAKCKLRIVYERPRKTEVDEDVKDNVSPQIKQEEPAPPSRSSTDPSPPRVAVMPPEAVQQIAELTSQ